ncbi:MAG: DNA polymerase III subunit alpha [Vulcanimicrobiota bacterium]
MSQFVHLHCHTEYSLLDGCNRINDMVKHAAQMGMPALAMTDHGVMYGAVQFYDACIKHGVKPLIGCEVYVAQRGMLDKEPGKDNRPYHFTLLAKDREGYSNLCQLVSGGHLDGYYYKPRVDRAMLEKHCKGLVALSGCLRGEVNAALLDGNPQDARRRLGELRDIFRDDLYVELMDHGIEEQRVTNIELIKMARDMNLKLVATNDAHYMTREDANIQDVLVCVQTGKLLNDTNRMKFFAPEFYIKTYEEMARSFGELPDALSNTLLVAEKINLQLDYESVYLPVFPCPDGMTSEEYLKKLCRDGLIWRFNSDNPGPEIMDRMQVELDVIVPKGFADYFLLVWDFINYARSQDIPVGPGRGSAAGSLVAFLLGITNINPLDHDLLFERFLNPERTELPDIDTDFCVERRGEVIQYVRNKFGRDKVAQIITFGRMKARAAIRDVARVMDMPLAKADKVAKAVPEGPQVYLKDALDSPEFKRMMEEDPEVNTVVETALRVEGMARNAGIHAAGVIVCSQPLATIAPLQKMNGDEIVVQFDMNDSSKIGMVKMDFLGLRNLTVIKDCLKIIKEYRGFDVDVDHLEPFQDPATYQLLSDADTNGVFQLESDGMKRYLKQLKPDKFSDIVAFLALYRPGPLQGGVVDDFIRRRHGRGGEVTYPHQKLEPILKDTYGFFLYQEQVMLTANVLAGYTLAMADGLRKAMGKKKMDVMEKHRKIFTEGAVERGVDKKLAGDIFETMEKFAAYGFNKSHSAAYAVVSYQTAYLKANYRTEYMAALMTSVLSSIEKVSFFIKECNQSGIAVLPPDVNESLVGFSVSDKGIRWGMGAVRNVGVAAVESIIAARKQDGPYKDLADLCHRVDLRVCNKRTLEGLIKAGGMDCFGENRATLLSALDACVDAAARAAKEELTGQFGLFDDVGSTQATFADLCPKRLSEFPKRQLLEMEREMLGVYLSDSPLSEVREAMKQHATHRIAQLNGLESGVQLAIAGLVSSSRKIITRFKTPMVFLQFEDETGTTEVTIRPATYEKCAPLLQDGALLLVRGRSEIRQARRDAEDDGAEAPQEQVKVTAEEILCLQTLAAAKQGKAKLKLPGVHIRVQMFQSDFMPQLRDILLRHRGDQEVYLHLVSPQGETVMHLAETFNVRDTNELKTGVRRLLGQEAIWEEAS